MGKRSRELNTGLTEEERVSNPKGNDTSLSMYEIRKITNRYIKRYQYLKKHMRVGRVGV